MKDALYMLSVAVAVEKNLCKILEDYLGNLGILMPGKSLSLDGYP